jgi:hypothetical protein
MPNSDIIVKTVRGNIGAILRWGVLALCAGAMAMADSRWVKQQERRNDLAETDRKIAVYQNMPARVAAIETWMLDRKADWQKNDAEHVKIKDGLGDLTVGLAVNTALLEKNGKMLESLLFALDQTRRDTLQAIQDENAMVKKPKP